MDANVAYTLFLTAWLYLVYALIIFTSGAFADFIVHCNSNPRSRVNSILGMIIVGCVLGLMNGILITFIIPKYSLHPSTN